MTNKKIVLASITVIVAAGLIGLSPSTMIGDAQAQMYANEYGYDNNYYQDDNRYSYDKKEPKSSHVDIQKIKCVNSNINVNGIDITQIPQDGTTLATANEGAADATGAQNGNGWGDKINFERNLVNICVNVNVNEQVKVTPPPEEEPSACEDCFSGLTEIQINRLLAVVDATSIGAYCDRLLDTPNTCQEYSDVAIALQSVPGITEPQIGAILDCLIETGVIISPTQC